MQSFQPIVDEAKRLVETRFAHRAPALYLDRRYNPQSPGLFIDIAYGGCMGPYLPNCSLVVHDRLLKPELGDVVTLEYPCKPGAPPERFGKVLDRIAGKLWGLSETAAPMPITPEGGGEGDAAD